MQICNENGIGLQGILQPVRGQLEKSRFNIVDLLE